MKKLLYILVSIFSLFFVIYALNQVGLSLYKEWGVLIAWFVLIKLLEKKLFKEEKEIEEVEEEDYDEDEDEDEDNNNEEGDEGNDDEE